MYLFPLILVGCQQQAEDRSQLRQAPSAIVLEIGDRQIDREQFRREITLNYPDFDEFPTAQQGLLKQQLMQQLIDRELIFAEAQQLQLSITDEELEEALAVFRGSYSSEEFDQALRRSGRASEVWREGMKLRLLTERIIDAVIVPQIHITEKELSDYYHAERESFRRPAEVRVHQMLLRTAEKALEIKKQLQDGEDFATLAQQYSISPDSETGGLLGYYSEGYLPPEFDAVIFHLPLREISDPVESPYGYHLFMVDRSRDAGLRTFVVVREEIAEQLYLEQEETVFQQWLKQLREKNHIRINWERIDEILPR